MVINHFEYQIAMSLFSSLVWHLWLSSFALMLICSNVRNCTKSMCPPFQPVSVGEGIIPYHSYDVVLLSIIKIRKHFTTIKPIQGSKERNPCTYTFCKISDASTTKYSLNYFPEVCNTHWISPYHHIRILKLPSSYVVVKQLQLNFTYYVPALYVY